MPQMPRMRRVVRRVTVTCLLTGTLGAANLGATAPSAAAAAPSTSTSTSTGSNGTGQCTFPMKKQYEGIPWPLQRVLLDELWHETKGRGVRVAVIDTGVDNVNVQLKSAVDAKSGADFLKGGKTDGTVDEVGHGTKVAGIIAARPRKGTGFVGLAPEATIIPIRQNDEKNSGNDETMAKAIDHAIAQRAHVINISQDTEKPLGPNSALGRAVRRALEREIVVVASAGNDGLNGRNKKTYPAAFDGVLAVAASDRNNERAAFSQPGDFVGVAAPGVDIVSTVPRGGQCSDNGTSFSAPYVSGVAALLRAKHPTWTAEQISTQIKQTAERSVRGHDDFVGWGVVDPVRALTEDDDTPPNSPTPDPGPSGAPAPEPAHLAMGETSQERSERYATYGVGAAVVLIVVVTGAAVTARDVRRRRSGSGD